MMALLLAVNQVARAVDYSIRFSHNGEVVNMGLLDSFNDPQNQGLLALASSLFQAGAPQSRRVGIGEALSGGLQNMNMARNQSEMLKRKQAMDEMTLQDTEMSLAQRKQSIADAERQKQLLMQFAQTQHNLQAQQPPQPQQSNPQSPFDSSPQNKLARVTGGFQSQQPQPQESPQAQQSPIKARIDALNQRADWMESQGVSGEGDRAKAIELQKMLPKYSTDYRQGLDSNGNMVNMRLADDGTEMASNIRVAPKLREINRGGVTTLMDDNKFTGTQDFSHTMSADTKANVGLGYARLKADKEKENNQQEAMFSSETLQQMAEQYRAGDNSVFVGIGRGAQGSSNIAALRKEITRQNNQVGAGGADQAAKIAEYFGTKAGQRTVGTRTANVEMAANEAQNLIPLARETSNAIARSGLLPFGKGQIMFNEQTNNPDMRKFAAANNSLVNVYARAISPSGVPAVSDKEHAREMLNTAMDQPSYNAVLDQMQKEISAAQAAPKSVRQAFSDSVTGKNSHAPTPTKDGWGIERVK